MAEAEETWAWGPTPDWLSKWSINHACEIDGVEPGGRGRLDHRLVDGRQPPGPKNGNGGQGLAMGKPQAFKPGGMNAGQGQKVGGGMKIDPKFGQGPKNGGGIKIDPGMGNGKGPQKGGGIKIDQGIGNGKGPNNGPKGPGFGNGMGMKLISPAKSLGSRSRTSASRTRSTARRRTIRTTATSTA